MSLASYACYAHVEGCGFTASEGQPVLLFTEGNPCKGARHFTAPFATAVKTKCVYIWREGETLPHVGLTAASLLSVGGMSLSLEAWRWYLVAISTLLEPSIFSKGCDDYENSLGCICSILLHSDKMCY